MHFRLSFWTIFVCVCLVIGLVAGSTLHTKAQAQPEPTSHLVEELQLEGFVGGVERSFDSVDEVIGIPAQRLTVSIYEFGNESSAYEAGITIAEQTALGLDEAQTTAEEGMEVETRVVSGPRMQDWSALYVVQVTNELDDSASLFGVDGVQIYLIILVVVDNKLVYHFTEHRISLTIGDVNGALDSDPVSNVLEVASRLFAEDGDGNPVAAIPGITHRTDGLWGQLPRLDGLPAGFVFAADVELPPLTSTECSGASGAVPANHHLADVTQALEAAGFSVQIPDGTLPRDAFPVPGQAISLDGQTVYVYVFACDADRAFRQDVASNQPEIRISGTDAAPIPIDEVQLIGASSVLVVVLGKSNQLVPRIEAALSDLP